MPTSTLNSPPILTPGAKITPAYLKALSQAINSDGCTVVSEMYHSCCLVHDLGYRFGVDPWGNSVSRREVDRSFRRCMQEKSPLGVFSPVSWLRWLGVRIFGRFFI